MKRYMPEGKLTRHCEHCQKTIITDDKSWYVFCNEAHYEAFWTEEREEND